MVTQSRAPRLPSVWTLKSLSGAYRRWPLGLITPQFGIASRAYLPGPRARLSLVGMKYPYWHVMNYALTARQSADNQILPQEDFILLALTGSSDQGVPAFRSQFFQVVDESTGFRLSRLGVNLENMFGSGQNPFILRRPYPMPNNRAFLNHVGDTSAAATNNIQVVLYGVKEWQQ